MLLRARPETCLSDLVLDRLIAGELDGSEIGTAARAHLERCEPCRSRKRTLEEAAARFETEIFISGAALKTARAAKRAPMRLGGSIGAAAAAVFIVMLVQTKSLEVRTKGALGLGIVARHLDGKTEQIFSGAEMSPGEAIRFEISSTRQGYLFIAGIDAAKNVTPYYPSTKDAQILPPAPGTLLEGSVTLDATLGPERIFAVLCDQPIEARRILERGRRALDRAGGDPQKIEHLDSGCAESSFIIHKVAAR
jgi:hypothetical protein